MDWNLWQYGDFEELQDIPDSSCGIHYDGGVVGVQAPAAGPALPYDGNVAAAASDLMTISPTYLMWAPILLPCNQFPWTWAVFLKRILRA
jgi:hypothetical protein